MHRVTLWHDWKGGRYAQCNNRPYKTVAFNEQVMLSWRLVLRPLNFIWKVTPWGINIVNQPIMLQHTFSKVFLMWLFFWKDDVIFNHSDRVLTKNEKNALARGLYFCLPPKHVKLGLLLTKGNQDLLKNQLKNISYSYIYSYDFLKQKNILRKNEWTALMDLCKDDSIIITQPGKGTLFS